MRMRSEGLPLTKLSGILAVCPLVGSLYGVVESSYESPECAGCNQETWLLREGARPGSALPQAPCRSRLQDGQAPSLPEVSLLLHQLGELCSKAMPRYSISRAAGARQSQARRCIVLAIAESGSRALLRREVLELPALALLCGTLSAHAAEGELCTVLLRSAF